MDTSTDDRPLVDEEIWRAWIQKGKLREEATARKLKKLVRIALAILALGTVFYLLAVRQRVASFWFEALAVSRTSVGSEHRRADRWNKPQLNVSSGDAIDLMTEPGRGLLVGRLPEMGGSAPATSSLLRTSPVRLRSAKMERIPKVL